MMFLFTTSNKIGARAIRWALNEPVSHFAICFDETENGYGIVFHSTMNGVKFDWWNNFYQHNKIVYALKPKSLGLQKEEQVYQAIVRRHYGRGYDIGAFLAFSYYALRRKFTGASIPIGENAGSADRYLCTELAHSLRELCPEFLPQSLPLSLISPYALFQNMHQSKELERVPWIASKP